MIFSKGRISEIFQRAYETIKTTIENETENYILNANEIEYSEHLESKHKLDIPELHFDQVNADSYEAEIPAEYFPFNFNVYEGLCVK